MSDSNNSSLEILIRTGHDGSGAAAAVSSIQKVTDTANAAADALERANKAAATPGAAQSPVAPVAPEAIIAPLVEAEKKAEEIKVTIDGALNPQAETISQTMADVEASAKKAAVSIDEAFNKNAGLATSPTVPNNGPDDAAPLTMEGVAAIEKTIAQLEKKIEVTQALGKATTQHQLALDKLNAALRTEDALAIKAARSAYEKAEAEKAAAAAALKAEEIAAKKANVEVTKELNEQNKILRNTAQALAIEVPLLGRAINLLTSPISAVVGAVALMVMAWKWAKDEINKSIKEIDLQSLNAPLEKQKENLDNATASAHAFANSLEDIAAGQDPLTKKFKDATEAARQLEVAIAALDSKQKAYEYETINAGVADGKMTQTQGIRAKQRVDEKYITIERNRKINAQNEQDSRDAGQLKTLGESIPQLRNFAKEREDELRKLKDQKDAAEKKVVDINGKGGSLNDIAKQKQAATDKLDDVIIPPAFGENFDSGAFIEAVKKERQEKLDKLVATERALMQQVKDLNKNIAKITSDMEEQSQVLERAKADASAQAAQKKQIEDRQKTNQKFRPQLIETENAAANVEIETSRLKADTEIKEAERKAKEKEERERKQQKRSDTHDINSKTLTPSDDGVTEAIKSTGSDNINLHSKTISELENQASQIKQLAARLDAVDKKASLIASTARVERQYS